MTSAVERLVVRLRDHGCDPKPAGGGVVSRCPAHADRRPSLSIREGADGRALVRCHANCTTEAVVESLKLTMADLFEFGPRSAEGALAANGAAEERRPRYLTLDAAVADIAGRYGPAPTRHWLYEDARGQPVGAVVRVDRADGTKEVRPLRAGTGGWVVGAMEPPRPLLGLRRLADVAPNEAIYVVEGETCVDAALSLGLTATTSSGGARAAAQSDWTALAGRQVVVLPDRDDAGTRYADDVARLVSQAGASSVRILRLEDAWPGLPAGGDLVDLLEHRGGEAARVREDLTALSEAIAVAPAAGSPRGVQLVRLSDIEPAPVRWLSRGRVAVGKLTLLVGDPGLGKSFVTIDLAARVSRGLAWLEADAQPLAGPGAVVFLSAEDDPADTIRPRLDSAGADANRVYILTAMRGERGDRAFDLSRDLSALEVAAASIPDLRLIVIDPISAYLGATDSHKNAEMRAVLGPLAAFAARRDVAVLCVSHLNKASGMAAIHRTIGSVAFAASARVVLAVVKDKRDPFVRLLVPVKSNIGRDQGGMRFTIQSDAERAEPKLVWLGSESMSADDALGDTASSGKPRQIDDAIEFLEDALTNGPRSPTELRALATDAGLSWGSVRRAKDRLEVEAFKTGMAGGWAWRLPSERGSA